LFVDRAKIRVYAGTGGSGSDAFLRERGRPRGGPAGGDGGRGGDVVLVVDPQLATLLDLTYRQHYKAERGQHGEGSNKTGRSGEDLEISVPPGTLARDIDSGEVLGDLVEPGDRLVIAKGGRGGRGNARFATSTRQAPRHWEPGEEGEERYVSLELKLIADVGLVGEPNAGKSTLVSVVSKARPKVADYPFTTLAPALGVVDLSGYRSFVMADIPGIIEGAHQGKGLGHQFLRHIERTRILAFCIPSDDPDPQATYDALRAEMAAYSAELAERPHCVVFTKMDLIPQDQAEPAILAPDAWATFTLSSVTRSGLDRWIEGLWPRISSGRAGSSPVPEEGWRP